jgi:hypothetical protein
MMAGVKPKTAAKAKARGAAPSRRPATRLDVSPVDVDALTVSRAADGGEPWARARRLAWAFGDLADVLDVSKGRPVHPGHVDLIERVWNVFVGAVGTQPQKAEAKARCVAFLRLVDAIAHKGGPTGDEELNEIVRAWLEPVPRGRGKVSRVWKLIAIRWARINGDEQPPTKLDWTSTRGATTRRRKRTKRESE